MSAKGIHDSASGRGCCWIICCCSTERPGTCLAGLWTPCCQPATLALRAAGAAAAASEGRAAVDRGPPACSVPQAADGETPLLRSSRLATRVCCKAIGEGRGAAVASCRPGHTSPCWLLVQGLSATTLLAFMLHFGGTSSSDDDARLSAGEHPSARGVVGGTAFCWWPNPGPASVTI